MSQDINKFFIILLAAALLGFLVDHLWLLLFLTAIAIIGWQIHRLDLLYKWVLSPKKNPLPETSGQFYLIHRELSRRNKKNSLRKKQLSSLIKQFRHAASTLPDTIVLIDKDDKIAWANKNAVPLLGIHWPSDSQVRFSNLIRNPDVITLLGNSKKGNQTGIDIASPVNPEKTVYLSVVRYTDEYRMVIARDITPLIKVNKMQSTFVANVSHELKTPLTVLKGYLEIIQSNHSLPDNLQKAIAQMSLQSERMQLIIQDLLYLAKLEDVHNEPFLETINVDNIVNAILETAKDKINQHQQQVKLDIDDSLRLIGNSTELHAAFSNLILNAISYTPKKGKISVAWYKSKTHAIFSVEDNGDGIPEKSIPYLTQRFYRVDSARARENGGTGLGLAIVKHVLQRHDAVLDIESQLELGSTFSCVFNISQTQQANLSAKA